MNVDLNDPRRGLPSASGMERLVLCPGSWFAEHALPEDGPNEAAEKGTELHRHMELGSAPEEPEEAELLDWVRKTEYELVLSHFGIYPGPMRERRWWSAAGSFSGQPDVVYVKGGVALLLDYKFGRAAVSASPANKQLAALAYLAFDNLPGVETVLCGIIQPLVSREVPQLVQYCRAEYSALSGYFDAALAAASVPGAPLCPGVVQCRYCRAAATCSACTAMVAAGSQKRDWAERSPERKAGALRLAVLAKKWAESIERRAREDLKNDVGSIPGFALAPGRSSFKITDAAGAFAVLEERCGIPAQEFARCCSVRISELDKVVHAELARRAEELGQKQLVQNSKLWLRECLAECGTTTTTEGCIKEV